MLQEVIPNGAVMLFRYNVNRAMEVNKRFAFKLIKGGARTYYFAANSENEMKRFVFAQYVKWYISLVTFSLSLMHVWKQAFAPKNVLMSGWIEVIIRSNSFNRKGKHRDDHLLFIFGESYLKNGSFSARVLWPRTISCFSGIETT